VKFVATKKRYDNKFFSLSCFWIRDPRSGMGKNQDPGCFYPGSATLVADMHYFDTDPDPGCPFDADPDPAFHFDADLDPDTTVASK
jgi:hypothetical protein